MYYTDIRHVWNVATGNTLRCPCYTRAYLSGLEMQHNKVLYKFTLLYFTLQPDLN